MFAETYNRAACYISSVFGLFGLNRIHLSTTRNGSSELIKALCVRTLIMHPPADVRPSSML